MSSRLLVRGLLAYLLFLTGMAVCVALPPPPASGVPGSIRPSVEAVEGAATENASDLSNPYSVIVERNIFHLNPPPPPPEPEKPKLELPVVKITGFVNNGGLTKVFFLAQPKDKKEGSSYYALVEGEKSGDHKLEFVKIHPAQDAVDVINDGVAVTLTVKDDTLGATGAPAPAAGEHGAGALGQGRAPGGPGMGMPGRQIHPGGPPQPGVPGAGQNGSPYPARARRNIPVVPQ